MKLACPSTAFDRQFAAGDLTQIEWLEFCARDIRADGVVLDVRHFPRTDDDYLAQIKKMAADLGLCVAALWDDAFFAASAQRMEATLAMALALGAPLLCAPLQAETQTTWSEALARLCAAASLAKRANVTLALRNAPQTFAAGTHDLKRASKEADSAWLRYAPDLAALDAGSEPQPLLPKSVLVWDLAQTQTDRMESASRLLAEFRGFLTLAEPEGSASVARMADAMRRWREVDRT